MSTTRDILEQLRGPSGAQFLEGDGVPDNENGNDGDIYIDNLTAYYYKKETGAWVKKRQLGVSRTPYEYTATEGQTDFACTYATAGLTTVDVWLNGIKLERNTDYIETLGSEGTSISFAQAAVLDDEIEIIVWE